MTITAKRHAESIDVFWHKNDPQSRPVYDLLMAGGSVDLVLTKSVLNHEVAA